MKVTKIGIVGVGGIANYKHLHELLTFEDVRVTAICDINPAALKSTGDKLSLPDEKRYTSYRDLIADPDVDAVEICTSNDVHAEIAIAALNAGKPINLEKPIALNYEQALEILEAEKNSSAFGMICFSYRFMAAARYAMHLMEENIIGDVVGINVAYLKNSAFWENRPLEWRFIKEIAGSGVTGDLGAHLIDLAQLLAGNITELCSVCSTVVKERKKIGSDEIGQVTTDDQCSFIVKFANGADGAFHITRCAIGHANTIRYDVYGTKGSISFDLNDPSILSLSCGEGDPKNLRPTTVKVPEEFYYMQERAFVDAVNGKRDFLFPTIADGVQGQKVIDAVIRSAEERRWVNLD